MPRTNTNTQPAPKAPRSRSPKAQAPEAPVYAIPEDFEALTKALKSAKGVLWTMNSRRKNGHHYDQATIDGQEAKVTTLQDAYDAVKPPRQVGGRQTGPRWMVTVDPITGKATDGVDAVNFKDAAALAKAAGLAVVYVAKVDAPTPPARARRSRKAPSA